MNLHSIKNHIHSWLKYPDHYKKKISELESQVDELERNNRELSDKIDDYKRKISALNE